MSHTLKVIAFGFALLVVCLVAARLIGGMGGANASMLIARAALAFIGLWFISAAINMWIGVSKAGYTVAEETPIFFIVFLIPAAAALFVWWRYSRS